MNLFHHVSFAACIAMTLAGCSSPEKKQEQQPTSLTAKIERFSPTDIRADTSTLSEGDRQALHVLYRAAALMDSLYLRQVWSGNVALRTTLAADRSALGTDRLKYFMMNMGPWSLLDHDEPFIPGVPQHPPEGANFYPEDITRMEFNTWLATLPDSQKREATGFFSILRRGQDGRLTCIPYNIEYRDLLAPAAQLLKEAAALTSNPSLRTFLNLRADAFLSNDYYQSDIAWMDLDSPIDVTIGPYEVYLDGLFNYKAAFEAYITLRNNEETAKLSRFATYLQEIENHLPIDKRYRNPKLGAMAPIRVVDEVDEGGQAKAGVQTAAFNLPNDERIVAEKGSKRVMLRNVQEAKFRKILVPIAGVAIDPAQQRYVAFEPFFTHILAHELMHGLGPHNIDVAGRKTTVRQEMKELGSALEEAKADISGLFALQYLVNRGVLDTALQRQMYVTFLASAFRTLRFGIAEAHGRGMVMQFNYLLDQRAIVSNDTTGTFSINFSRIKGAVAKLTGEIMTIQAHGDYERAKELLTRDGAIRPSVQRVLDRLTDVPVDILPQFPMVP